MERLRIKKTMLRTGHSREVSQEILNLISDFKNEKSLLVELVEKILSKILNRTPNIDDLKKVTLASHNSSTHPCQPERISFGFAYDSVIYGVIERLSDHDLSNDKSRYGFNLGYEFIPNHNYTKHE